MSVRGKTKEAEPPSESIGVERVQTGIRIEKRLLKVLKGLAEYHDLTVGDLLEGIVLHAFDGRSPFGDESLRCIEELKRIYKLDLDSSASHRLSEKSEGRRHQVAQETGKRKGKG